MNNRILQITKLIDQAESILIMPSSPPDGDSLGSAIALYLALQKLNKKNTVVCADPIPDSLEFLPMINAVSNEFSPSPDFIITLDTLKAELGSIESQVEENKVNIILTAKSGQFSQKNISFSQGPNLYDLIITVDTASLQQLGKFYEDNVKLFTDLPVINIDHHISNEQFGLVNYIDVLSSSTTEITLSIIEGMEEKYEKELIDEDIATLLLAGIITDTGSFQHSNTNPKSFANSAKLIKRGARQQEIIQNIYKTKKLSTLRLWGRVLSNIKIEKDHRFLWSKISHKDLLDTGSSADETGDIIDELMSNAPNTDIVLLLKEKSDGLLYGSLRTLSDNLDASEIASLFGGGGHHKAAGFRIKDASFESHGQMVIQKILDYQAKRLNLLQKGDETFTKIPNNLKETIENIQVEEIKKQKNIQSAKESKLDEAKDENIISKSSKTNKKLKPGVKYTFES